MKKIIFTFLFLFLISPVFCGSASKALQRQMIELQDKTYIMLRVLTIFQAFIMGLFCYLIFNISRKR